MSPDGPTVLIAEDEPLASMALRAQVEALGYTVPAIARDGAEAVALGRCLPAQLGVFDMKMPGLSGLDAAIELFPEAPVPIVLLTGFGAADLPAPIPAPPVFAVLTKPIGLAELRKGIQDALDAFQTWVSDTQMDDEVNSSLQERRLIARALELQEGEASPAAAAARLLDHARQTETSPANAARQILQDQG